MYQKVCFIFRRVLQHKYQGYLNVAFIVCTPMSFYKYTSCLRKLESPYIKLYYTYYLIRELGYSPVFSLS